jgi:Domain of unknown function (DUF4150)
MATVAIHPPKTPVHKGIRSMAKATIPNICKMPGPPAPFVPAPLPNIAKSELSPKNYSTSVEIEGNIVAIRGATYESIGDMASKGTGGGLISANCHGPAKFIAPGSMTVKIEGKNVHLLGDSMLNNCGPSGSPPNTGATMSGTDHEVTGGKTPCAEFDCDKEVKHNDFGEDDSPVMMQGKGRMKIKKTPRKCTPCEKEQVCNKLKQFNRDAQDSELERVSPKAYEAADIERKSYNAVLNTNAQNGTAADLQGFWTTPGGDCEAEVKKKCVDAKYKGHSPDHIKDIGLGGLAKDHSNLKWMQSDINSRAGGCTGSFDPAKGHTGVKITNCCPPDNK